MFPVVVPLSDKKLGPQDARSPHEEHSQLREGDLQHDSWSFKRDRAQAATSRLQRLDHGLRLRAEEAERGVFTAEKLASQRMADIEAAAQDRRKRGDDAERELLMRIQEAKVRLQEAERECADRVAEAKMILVNEQAHTADVKALLEQERHKSEDAWKKVGEAQAESRDRLSVRDGDLERQRAEATARVEEARKAAADRVKQAQERSAAELRHMQEQLEAAKAKSRARVDLEARRKASIEDEVQHRKETAAVRLDLDMRRMRQSITDQQDSCVEQVRRVERREADTKDFVETWKAGSVAEIFATASKKSMQAHHQEAVSTQSLAHAVNTLGKHYKTQRQYNTTVDGKISHALQGCLHGPLPTPASPASARLPSAPGSRQTARGCPSPRSLPPPSACPAFP